MDRLPFDVLKTVQGLLPWQDRLIARQLSSKFVSPPYWKNQLEDFFLREEKDSVYLTLQWDKEEKVKNKKNRGAGEKRRIIEIIKEINPDNDIVILQTTSEKEGKVLRKTTVVCPTIKQYLNFIDTYLQLIFTHFSIWSIYLINLSHDVLTKIDASRLRDNVHPGLIHDLEFHTPNNILTTEEKQLLNWSKEHYHLCFVPPVNFQVTADFWDIVSINDLTLDFGGLNEKGVVVDVNLGIDDNFIAQRVMKGQLGFRTMTISRVSLNFIIRYCQGAYLKGYSIMFCLCLPHSFSRSDITALKDQLLADGFQPIYRKNNVITLAKVVEIQVIAKGEGIIIETRQTKSGYDPDRMIVTITNSYFEISCDYACYRGKKSIVG